MQRIRKIVDKIRKRGSRPGAREKIAENSVPIVIDDVKKYKNFSMARCTYFSIESDVPTTDWILELDKQSIPFHLFGVTGIIIKPLGRKKRFDSPGSIDRLFDMIERHPSLYVDANEIWLPNFLFKSSVKRGHVYRIASGLFKEAHLFQQNQITKEKFFETCTDSKQNIYYSAEETKSFKNWANEQIKSAKKRFPKNRDLELKYRK